MSTITPTSDQRQSVNVTSFLISDTVQSLVDGRIGVIVSPDGAVPTVATGTITIVTGSPSVVGTDTKFTKDAPAGTLIYIGSNQYRVAHAISDTNLTLTQPITNPSVNNTLYANFQPGSVSQTESSIPTTPSTNNVKVAWQDQTSSVVAMSTLRLVSRGAY